MEKIKAPILPAELTDATDFLSLMEADPYLHGIHFQNCRIGEHHEKYIHFDGCVFENVEFEAFDWENLDVFINCELSNCKLLDGALHRLEFRHCRMMGCDFGGSTLVNITFSQNNARYANFSGTKLKHVRFDQSDLSMSSFNQCVFFHTAFDTCHLKEAEFINTPLKGLDLSTSDIEGITVNAEHLQGVIVSEMQALSLARLLGLIIR